MTAFELDTNNNAGPLPEERGARAEEARVAAELVDDEPHDPGAVVKVPVGASEHTR